jgi:hypothetical protein
MHMHKLLRMPFRILGRFEVQRGFKVPQICAPEFRVRFVDEAGTSSWAVYRFAEIPSS